MKTLINIKILTAILLLSGCAWFQGILPGNDSAVVAAEQTTVIATETINTFLQLERNNQTIIKQNAPAIHAYANYVRTNAPEWIASARTLTAAYKNNRTPQNKANLQTALDLLSAVLGQVAQYTNTINQLH